MFKKLLLVVLGLALISGAVYGFILRYDYRLLKSSVVFAEGEVGYEPYLPFELRSLNRIKASPFAVPIFKLIEINGTNEGRMYALKALKELDNEYFVSLEPKYRFSAETANCMAGYTAFRVNLSELFE